MKKKELNLKYVLSTGCTKHINFTYTRERVTDLEDLQFFLKNEHNITVSVVGLVDLALGGSCHILYDDGFMQTTGQMSQSD